MGKIDFGINIKQNIKSRKEMVLNEKENGKTYSKEWSTVTQLSLKVFGTCAGTKP